MVLRVVYCLAASMVYGLLVDVPVFGSEPAAEPAMFAIHRHALAAPTETSKELLLVLDRLKKALNNEVDILVAKRNPVCCVWFEIRA